MTISEEDRRQLYDGLAGAIGDDSAEVLMELLPRSPSGELVTRTDMHANTLMLRGEMAELRGEMAELRSELRGEMADLRSELRGEMAQLRGELQADMADLRSELSGMMDDLSSELRGEMATLRLDLAKWMWTMWASNVAVMVALVLLVVRISP